MVDIVGGLGGVGGERIVAGAEAAEVQPLCVTVKEYVPGINPEIVVVVPEPLVVVPVGAAVITHVPLEGNPIKSTLPVAVEQVV